MSRRTVCRTESVTKGSPGRAQASPETSPTYSQQCRPSSNTGRTGSCWPLLGSSTPHTPSRTPPSGLSQAVYQYNLMSASKRLDVLAHKTHGILSFFSFERTLKVNYPDFFLFFCSRRETDKIIESPKSFS